MKIKKISRLRLIGALSTVAVLSVFYGIYEWRVSEEISNKLINVAAKGPLTFQELPVWQQRALLAKEDGLFLIHRGINWEDFWWSMHWNLTNLDKPWRGGSSITMQLVSFSHLGNRRSFLRKLRQFVLAPLVDAKVGKIDQLNAYINLVSPVFLGRGLNVAASHMFKRSIHELNFGEYYLLLNQARTPTDKKWWKSCSREGVRGGIRLHRRLGLEPMNIEEQITVACATYAVPIPRP